MKKSNHQFITKGSGLVVKALPPTWCLYAGPARCCAAVGFFTAGKLRLTSYVVLN